MAILIPEIVLYNLLEAIFEAIRVDFHNHTDERDTLLYSYFGDIKAHKNKYKWFDQAKDLFLREEDHPRKIEVEMFFNSERARIPTVHITLPGEQATGDGIGVDEGYQEAEFYDKDLTFRHVRTRMFDAQYQILITSDNTLEVQMLYNFVRGMLISIFDKVELAGLRNPKLSGQDLRLDSSLIPEHIFVRALGIHCQYEVDVPEYFTSEMIANILASGKPTI